MKKKKNSETYGIELLILRIFLKHVKMHHLYHRFRCSVGVSNRHKDLFHIIASRVLTNYNAICKLGEMGSYYMNAKSLDEIAMTIRGMNGNKLKIENDGNGQMMVMNIVNGLIHSCIEYAIGNDFTVLEEIGEGAFTEICQNLFGDGFVDKTAELFKPEQMELLERYGRMMPPPNMGRRHRGDMIPPPIQTQVEFSKWIEEYLANRSHEIQMNTTQPTFRNDNMNVGYWGDIEYEDEPWD